MWRVRSSPRGFTLLELLLLIIVLAIGLVGILMVFNVAVVGSPDPMVRKQAMAVAESMMEEILLQPLAAGGWSGAATQANRQNFDDVGDYSAFATTGILPINSLTVIPGLEAYNLNVAVASATLGGVSGLRVTVTVTGPRVTFQLDGYKLY
jgi:MSHA pilin protein MshD